MDTAANIGFEEISSDMIAAGFWAEDRADQSGASRADRVSAIYAAMEATRRRGLPETREVDGTAPISPLLSRESGRPAGPGWTVPVFRARGPNRPEASHRAPRPSAYE